MHEFVDLTLDVGTRADGKVVREDVGRHGAEVLRDAPDVQVVDAKHAVDLHYVFDKSGRVDIARLGFEQDVDRVAQDAPGVVKNEEADEHADERVEPVGFCEVDDDTRNDRADGGKDITHEMNKRRTQVEVGVASLMDKHRCDDVDDDGDQPNTDEHARLHFGWVDEAVICLIKNSKRDDDKRGRVDERNQDADSMIAIGLAFVGGTGGDANGEPTQAERDDIGQVVGGIGEQGEAVREYPRGGFDKDEGKREEQRDGQSLCGLSRGIAQVGMGV